MFYILYIGLCIIEDVFILLFGQNKEFSVKAKKKKKKTSYKVEESIRKVHIRARAEGGELVSKLYKEISKHISKNPNKENGQRA